MNIGDLIGMGMVIGLSIGLTGIGSGSLLTPLLILWAGMPPVTAIGTSLAFSCATKLYGGWSFSRRGWVHGNLLKDLTLGGVPGVLAGAAVVYLLRMRAFETLNLFLLRAVGVMLIVASVTTFIRLLPAGMPGAALARPLPLSSRPRRLLMILAGFLIGLSVVLTSIGSGATLLPVMILLYRLDARVLVGTNIAQAAILSAIAVFPYAGFGYVQWKAVAILLCGSIPAVWLSNQFYRRVPRQIPEGIIGAVLLAMGLHVLLMRGS